MLWVLNKDPERSVVGIIGINKLMLGVKPVGMELKPGIADFTACCCGFMLALFLFWGAGGSVFREWRTSGSHEALGLGKLAGVQA